MRNQKFHMESFKNKISYKTTVTKPQIETKDRKRVKTLGDNSLKTKIIELIGDLDKGFIDAKHLDKETLKLYKSSIKILPHEFLFLMVNSK